MGWLSVIDLGARERLEEWALQRFQRLFPERISARLVTHAKGRRATDCALCSSIIQTYHRLLLESQVEAANATVTATPAATGDALQPTPFAAGIPVVTQGGPQAQDSLGLDMMEEDLVEEIEIYAPYPGGAGSGADSDAAGDVLQAQDAFVVDMMGVEEEEG